MSTSHEQASVILSTEQIEALKNDPTVLEELQNLDPTQLQFNASKPFSIQGYAGVFDFFSEDGKKFELRFFPNKSKDQFPTGIILEKNSLN